MNLVRLRTAVILIPVVFYAPLVRFDVPPPVIFVPAIFAGLGQFVARMFGLLAVIPMVLDRFMKIVIRSLGTVLAFSFTRAHPRHAGEEQKACQGRKGHSQLGVLQDSHTPIRLHSLLLSSVDGQASGLADDYCRPGLKI
jgi:hypothetical protein